MADDFTPTGTDTDLDRILGDTYTCSRAWSAWELGTMTEEDFEEAAHSPVVGDLIAWRDAAVAGALEAAQKPAEPAGPTLANQVTADLLEAGFRQHDRTIPASLAAFTITEGAGVVIGLSWDADRAWRGRVLAKMASVLRSLGYDITERTSNLYVPGPRHADRETAELTDIAYDRTHPDPYRNWVNGGQPAPGEDCGCGLGPDRCRAAEDGDLGG